MSMRNKSKLTAILIGMLSLLLAGCFAVSNFMRKDMVVFSASSSNIINILMDTINIQEDTLNHQQYNDLVILENNIRNDTRIHAIIEKMTPYFIHDLLYEPKTNMQFLRDDFITIINDYSNELIQFIPDHTANKKAVLLQRLDTLPVDSIYKQQITRLKGRINILLYIMLSVIYILSMAFMKFITLGCLLISLGVWISLRKAHAISTLPLSIALCSSGGFIILMFFASKVAVSAFPNTLMRYIGSLDPSTFYIAGIFGGVYIAIGLWMYMYRKFNS